MRQANRKTVALDESFNDLTYNEPNPLGYSRKTEAKVNFVS